jgi:GNAT superfamily N-acetyltransferase
MHTQQLAGYEISDDKTRLDVDVIHGYLTKHSYWAAGIGRSVVEKSIEHSLCLGVYHEGAQVGFGRVVTDRATFALLADVFVLDAHRGKGLSKWLMQCVVDHEELQGLRRLLLLTLDAHGLYAQYGFTPLAAPERFMEILKTDIYQPIPAA